MTATMFAELVQRRTQLKDTLDRLFAASEKWRGRDRQRGAHTIEHVTQQLVEVESELGLT